MALLNWTYKNNNKILNLILFNILHTTSHHKISGTTTHYLFKPGYINRIPSILAYYFSECDEDELDSELNENDKHLVKKLINKYKNEITTYKINSFNGNKFKENSHMYSDASILLNGCFQYGDYDRKYCKTENKDIWEKNSNNFKNFKLMYFSNQRQKNELFVAKKICTDYLLNKKYPITPGKHYYNILGEPIKIDYSISKTIYKYEPMPFYGGILIKKTRLSFIPEEFFRLLNFCCLFRIFTVDSIQYNDKNTISIIEYDSSSG